MQGGNPSGPAEPLSAEPRPADEMVVADVVTPPPGGPPPVAIFLGITLLLIASIGASALVLAGAGRVSSDEPEPAEATATLTSAPARTAGAAVTATTAGTTGRVRVVSATARSRPVATGAQHELTFAWTLEGAREGDAVVLQFYAGTRPLGQQRGTLAPSVFNFSTGVLTLTATMDCSTGGWTAELLTVRGQPIEGDSEASAPGVACR
jgi:hypothetical protein